RIRRMSVTPWFGLKLTGITMPQAAEGTGDFLRADTFRLRVRLLSLFSRRLVINEISLVNPDVVWSQNADGKWRLPSDSKENALQGPAAETAEQPAASAAPGEASASPQRASSPQAIQPTEAGAAFTPEVRRVSLTNGVFHFLDEKGKRVATFEGVGFRSSLRNSSELNGNASVEKISLRDRFFLKELKSPVQYDAAELAFSKIFARAGGGEITGQFSMRPADEGSPFAATVAFHDVSADRVLTDAGGPVGMLIGRLEGKLEASGKTADANALAGTGEIYLRDGEVRQFSLLVALGQLLQIDELMQLRLEQAQVKYHIAPGVVTIDESLLASPNLRLSATGTIDFQGKLHLESRLAINERIRSRLFPGMRESFRPVEEAGFSAVDFQVTGTLDKPKTNLMGKVVGKELKDLGGVINSLLGGGKAERKKSPKPVDQATPTATPSPAAAIIAPGEDVGAPDEPSPTPAAATSP
ncbi:MAG: hypothetical protein M3Z22_06870, partial [Verrucomicrobiota bacterium]|nr:hypothetical protein [Verrucomicrobiota bacterium]